MDLDVCPIAEKVLIPVSLTELQVAAESYLHLIKN